MDIVKYAALISALLVSFSGAWIYEFTRTDSESGKKHLTKPGKYAIVIAVLAAILALASSIRSDISSQKKSVALAESASLAKSQRGKLIELIELLVARENTDASADVSAQSRRSALQERLKINYSKQEGSAAREALRLRYPDLDRRFEKATTAKEIFDIASQSFERTYENRVKSLDNCQGVEFPSLDNLRYYDVVLPENISIRVSIAPGTLWLSVTDPEFNSGKRLIDWSEGFYVKTALGEVINFTCIPGSSSDSCIVDIAAQTRPQEILQRLAGGIEYFGPKSDEPRFKMPAAEVINTGKAFSCVTY